jgi:hypothetical protein
MYCINDSPLRLTLPTLSLWDPTGLGSNPGQGECFLLELGEFIVSSSMRIIVIVDGI